MIVRYTLVNIPRRSLGQAKLINPDAGSPGSQPPADPVPQQPAAAPAAPVTAPVAPPVASVPQPRWVNEGGNDLTRTLLAAGTVAALAIAGIVFFK